MASGYRWTDWPWALIPPDFPTYEDRHIQEGKLDNFLNECDELGSPLNHLNSGMGHMTTAPAWAPTLRPILEEEMESETAQALDQAWVPTK